MGADAGALHADVGGVAQAAIDVVVAGNQGSLLLTRPAIDDLLAVEQILQCRRRLIFRQDVIGWHALSKQIVLHGCRFADLLVSSLTAAGDHIRFIAALLINFDSPVYPVLKQLGESVPVFQGAAMDDDIVEVHPPGHRRQKDGIDDETQDQTAEVEDGKDQ